MNFEEERKTMMRTWMTKDEAEDRCPVPDAESDSSDSDSDAGEAVPQDRAAGGVVTKLAGGVGLQAGCALDLTTLDEEGNPWDFNLPTQRAKP